MKGFLNCWSIPHICNRIFTLVKYCWKRAIISVGRAITHSSIQSVARFPTAHRRMEIGLSAGRHMHVSPSHVKGSREGMPAAAHCAIGTEVNSWTCFVAVYLFRLSYKRFPVSLQESSGLSQKEFSRGIESFDYSCVRRTLTLRYLG